MTLDQLLWTGYGLGILLIVVGYWAELCRRASLQNLKAKNKRDRTTPAQELNEAIQSREGWGNALSALVFWPVVLPLGLVCVAGLCLVRGSGKLIYRVVDYWVKQEHEDDLEEEDLKVI